MGLAVAKQVLQDRGVVYTAGKTWTTDAIYRETKGKIDRRREEGCLTVEMAAAAFFAVARFRGIRFSQLLYAGDDLSGESWDHRSWKPSPSRQMIFELEVQVALAL